MSTKLSRAELDRLIPSLCTRCGKCCLNETYMGNLQVTTKDVRRWQREGRDDILRYVDSPTPDTHDVWIKQDGKDCTRCPFVRKDRNAATYTCRIYETRPQPCRDYPHSYDQMKLIGCEIIDELEKRGIDATGWGDDIPKTPTNTNKDAPEKAAPKAPTKSKLPTLEELRARGFKVIEPTGKGFMFIHPMGRPPAKKD